MAVRLPRRREFAGEKLDEAEAAQLRELREEDREGCERVDHEEATRIDEVAGLGRRLTSARERLASARRRSDEA